MDSPYYFSVYIPAVYVLNKIDQITIEELDILFQIPNVVPISAHNMWNIDELLERIWQRLNFIRMHDNPDLIRFPSGLSLV